MPKPVPNPLPNLARRLRGLFWTALLAALVLGVPVLLWWTRAVEPPTSWPSVESMWRTIRQGRVSHDAAIGALALAVLVIWFRFVLGVAVAVRSVRRHLPARRVRGLGTLSQSCALAIVSGAALLVSPSPSVDATPVDATQVDDVPAERERAEGRRDRAATTADRTKDRSTPRKAGTRPVAVGTALDTRPTMCPVIAEGGRPEIPVGLGAALLVAGGVLLRVERSRRRQLRSVTNATVRTAGTMGTTDLECRLHDVTPVERLVRLDMAMRIAGLRLDPADRTARVLGAIVRADGSVELLLRRPLPPAGPFVAGPGDRWCLPGAVALDALSTEVRGADAAPPTIAHLGVADGGDLFVDLAAVGTLAIDGPGEEDHVLRAVLLGLVTSPFAQGLSIIGLGFDVTAFGLSPAATDVAMLCALDVDDVLDIAAESAGSVMVVIGHEFDHETRSTIADLGLTVVALGQAPGARWTLGRRAGWWVLDPPGVVVRPVRLGDDDVSDIRRLLTDVDRSIVPIVGRTLDRPTAIPSAPAPAPVFEEPNWTFVVRVLGPVSVERRDGTTVVFDKSRSAELITWLALHRERQSRAGARTAMWDLDVQDATFANVVSEARRALARSAPVGEEWLGRTLGDTLPLHPGVVTDADLLEARRRHAQGQSLTAAVDTLRTGLSWVRGMPCSDAGYRWPDADGTTSQLVILVTAAAVEMATLCLTVDDLDGVFWATGRGLMALPGHEELVGLRMRGYARRGDLAGVRHEWDTYRRALRADGWGDDTPSPKLVALRDELLAVAPCRAGGRAPTGSGVV